MPSLTVERVSVNLVPESGPASASPPEIKTVRGQAIDAKQRVPYIVGVSAALTGARGLSMQLVTLPPAAPAARMSMSVPNRRSSSCLGTWKPASAKT